MRRKSLSFAVGLLITLIPALSPGQERPGGNPEASHRPVTVLAGSTGSTVRFTALALTTKIRLEVFSPDAMPVYDSGFVPGNRLEWDVVDQRGAIVPDSLYGCIVTVEDLSGQLSRRQGVFSASRGDVSFNPTDWKSAAAASDEHESLTVLQPEDALSFTVVSHDGKEGRIESTGGALSLHAGSLLRDGDGIPQLRLTPEGNVGIGVAEPKAKLEVAGLIRASEGFQFADGTVLKIENGLPVLVAGRSRGEPGGASGTTSRFKRVLAAGGSVDVAFAGEGPGEVFGREDGSPANNTTYGSGAGLQLTADSTTCRENSFFGTASGNWTATGVGNSFFGYRAGLNTNGVSQDWAASLNSFFGSQAGSRNTTGKVNTFLGAEAGAQNSTGSENSIVGYGAGFYSTTGSRNLFLGRGAGNSNTTEHDNSFIGAYSNGQAGITNATAVGYRAAVTQSNSLVLGSIKGVNGASTDTRVGIGTTAPTSPLTVAGDIESNSGFKIGGARVLSNPGTENTFVGVGPGLANTTGFRNSFAGNDAGRNNTTGTENSFFGYRAGTLNTTGNSNSVFGARAGYTNAGGFQNSFFGAEAGNYNSTGSDNSFVGHVAGFKNLTGNANAFFGKSAGANNSTGHANSFIGTGAGGSNVNENNNSFVGAYSDGAVGISNSTALGYRSKVTQTNSLVLGSISGVNGATADTNVGIGTTAPLARLHVQNGDIYVGSPGQGIVLESPDGRQCVKLSIDNSGALVTTAQGCPGAAPAPSETLYAAQFANGDGTTSELVLCNPSATVEISGQAAFFDNDGRPMPVGILGSSARTTIDFQLKPLGMVLIATDGLGSLASGSVQVRSVGTIAGFLRFNDPRLGVTGVGSSEPLRGFAAPVRAKAGSVYSGIAIQNIESSAVSITLTLKNRDGDTVPNGTATISGLAGLGHTAAFVHQLFPNAVLDDFSGLLIAEVSGGRVAATALELGSTAGQFTTLPVTPLR
jgi:hypothetical protein